MSVDLLSQVKQAFDAPAVREMGVALDEPPERVEQALALGAPAMLAGLLRAANLPDSAGALMDALKGVAGSASLPGEAPGREGQPMLRALFGERLGRVIDVIADACGASSASTTAILGALAPVVARLVREALGGSFSLDGLRRLLAAQAPAIARSAPGGLADALGVNSLAELGTPAPRIPAERPAPHVEGPEAVESSLARWGIPVALGVLVLFAAYSLLPPTREAEAPAVPGAPPEPGRPAAEVADRAAATDRTAEGRPVVETSAKRAAIELPGGGVIEAPEGSYLATMVEVLRAGKPVEARAFVAGDLAFDADGALAPGAKAAVDRIAKVAAAFPDAKFRVDGRETLKDVDPEKAREAARRRAEAVREALVAAGVPAERISADVVAPNLPAEHPAAVGADDVPISISILAD